MESYTLHVRRHIVPAIGDIQLRELTATDVNRMLASMIRKGVSPATTNMVRGTLRTALVSAVKAQLVRSNAAALSDPRPRTRLRITPLTAEQARRLIKVMRDDRMGPLIEVALATGMRQGELLALRWSDVDLEHRVVHVRRTLTWAVGDDPNGRRRVPVFSDPKTEQSRRSIPLTRSAVDALRRQKELVASLEQLATVSNWRPIEGEDLVFPSTVGTPLSGGNVTHRLQAILMAAGLPRQRFHDLRHGTASLLLAEGVDIFTVKEILGHAQISMTANIYGHLTDKLAYDAADRLDRALADDALTPKVTTDTIDSGSTAKDGRE